MVLGYFGRTPVAPDPEIVKLASKQLDKPVFTGNPLDLLDDDPAQVDTLLQENGLELSDENRFIAASCEEKGVDYLLGKAKLMIRKQSNAAPAPTSAPEAASQVAVSPVGPRSYTITVEGRAYPRKHGTHQSRARRLSGGRPNPSRAGGDEDGIRGQVAASRNCAGRPCQSRRRRPHRGSACELGRLNIAFGSW